MKTLATLLVSTLCLCSLLQISYSAEAAKTPKDLLQKILALAEAKKYDQINPYIVQVHIGEMKLEKMLLEEIVKNEESSSGDLAYSDSGLKKVIQKHGNQFNHISDFWKKELREVIKNAPELKNVPWNKYQLLEQGGIHIVVVETSESFKLIFWQNINKALKESKGGK